MTTALHSSLLDRWRQRISRCEPKDRRPLGALGHVIAGPIVDGLVELERLTLVVLYDEPVGPGQIALRLAGFYGSQVPWGVTWGGSQQSRFFKDLSLQPVPQACGARLALDRPHLLRLGLQLDSELDRHAHNPSLPTREHLRLPCLWAAFRRGDALDLVGDGPELNAYCRRVRQSPQNLLAGIRRYHDGLSLYPLAWVSHHWEQAVTVFADLARFPRQQVFQLDRWPADLIGYQDAAEFDFFHSRFRNQAPLRCRSVAV